MNPVRKDTEVIIERRVLDESRFNIVKQNCLKDEKTSAFWMFGCAEFDSADLQNSYYTSRVNQQTILGLGLKDFKVTRNVVPHAYSETNLIHTKSTYTVSCMSATSRRQMMEFQEGSFNVPKTMLSSRMQGKTP